GGGNIPAGIGRSGGSREHSRVGIGEKQVPHTPFSKGGKSEKLFPIPDSRFPIPDSRFPIPDSRFPIPYSSRLPPLVRITTAAFRPANRGSCRCPQVPNRRSPPAVRAPNRSPAARHS